jgi:hypothetical protein
VARILDNVKNNVDTTLYDAPELTAPDMTQRSGVTSSSAGTPKLTMTHPGAMRVPSPMPTPSFTVPAPPSPAPAAFPSAAAPSAASPSPSPAPLSSPFDASPFAATELEDDPFGAVAVAEEDPSGDDDLFASAVTPLPDEPPIEVSLPTTRRADVEALLAGARQTVEALERALEVAREHQARLRVELEKS